jgi:glycine/D-amino acid oxidase-like deaminating enzyme
MKSAYEFPVVGIGGIGSGAAYCPAREAGPEVLGLEQFPLGHDHRASQDHSRIIVAPVAAHALKVSSLIGKITAQLAATGLPGRVSRQSRCLRRCDGWVGPVRPRRGYPPFRTCR